MPVAEQDARRHIGARRTKAHASQVRGAARLSERALGSMQARAARSTDGALGQAAPAGPQSKRHCYAGERTAADATTARLLRALWSERSFAGPDRVLFAFNIDCSSMYGFLSGFPSVFFFSLSLLRDLKMAGEVGQKRHAVDS